MKKITIKSHEVKSQADAVLWHLKKYGSITSYEAIKEYGATRLSAIIFNHRKKGYYIDSKPLVKKTRFGRTTTIAKYLYTPTRGLNKHLNMYCEVDN
ncbi:MAG: hypothetical protein Unbinned3065contig1007_18 [Prokaryotic dsDNA virus sp.]|nr:MAG: hypothetical protein Unbinned3065contig1007_18 [Prokaryotic dsDNA virus sp.]|tara:strand:- start:11096 stop:11386 length:291 start_codon:yes stop_codon:yes gene_type:complete